MTEPDAQESTERRVPADPVPVEVEMHGDWHRGSLIEWQRWEDRGWMAYCSWSVGVGQQHMMWVTARRVRPRDAAQD